MSKVDDFIARVNKKYGEGTAATAEMRDDLEVSQVSTGSLEMDLATGGGWPRSRTTLIYGPRSSGKTTIAVMACSEVQRHCSECHQRMNICKCQQFVGGVALVLDVEGTFDLRWAVKNGFDEKRHTVVRPTFGEEAIDIVDTAIRETVYDMIVFDSIATCTPTCEIESSAEDTIIGKHAILMNKAMRKWTNALITVGRKGPALLCINQPREKVGVIMGDNMTLPGGKGQMFAATVEIRLKTGKVHDQAGSTTNAYVEISGTVAKNKLYVPKEPFEFHLALQDYEQYTAGDVNNIEAVVKRAKKLGWVTTGGGQWKVFEPTDLTTPVIDVKGKEALIEALMKDPQFERELYDWIVAESLIK